MSKTEQSYQILRECQNASSPLDQDAISQLATLIIAQQPSGAHSRRGYEKLVRRHFGQNIGARAVFADMSSEMDSLADVALKQREINAILNSVRDGLPKEGLGLFETGLTLIKRIMRGGERSGAGRKKRIGKRKFVGVKLPPDLIEWIDSQPGTRTAVIEGALRRIREY